MLTFADRMATRYVCGKLDVQMVLVVEVAKVAN